MARLLWVGGLVSELHRLTTLEILDGHPAVRIITDDALRVCYCVITVWEFLRVGCDYRVSPHYDYKHVMNATIVIILMLNTSMLPNRRCRHLEPLYVTDAHLRYNLLPHQGICVGVSRLFVGVRLW